MENKIDLSKILESKSEERLIKLSKKLLTKELTKEEQKEIIVEIKKEIINLTQNKSTKIKELYSVDEKNILKIDDEKIDFALKLIYKDKDIFDQLDRLKNKKRKQIKLDELIELRDNLEKTHENLVRELDRINVPQYKESRIPLIKGINKRIIEKNKKRVLGEQLDRVTEVIEQSKHPENIKNLGEYFVLKEKFYDKENIKETLDLLVKKCNVRDISNLSDLRKKLKKQYQNILESINKEIEELKKETNISTNYDKRLVEYIYNKQKNYITQILDYPNSNDSIFINIILILKMISQYEKNDIKLTYISPNINKKTNYKQNNKQYH